VEITPLNNIIGGNALYLTSIPSDLTFRSVARNIAKNCL